MQKKVATEIRKYLADANGASLVEYSVALIVVTLVGVAIFALGGDIAAIIDLSAGAF